jgi:hypothetical protein
MSEQKSIMVSTFYSKVGGWLGTIPIGLAYVLYCKGYFPDCNCTRTPGAAARRLNPSLTALTHELYTQINSTSTPRDHL